MKDLYDVVVIGSGPAGMAAAVSAFDHGASVCLVEREGSPGGILKQCIHDGFGLIRFNEQLTGPEYAWRYTAMIREREIDFLHTTFLTGFDETGEYRRLKFVNPERGTFSLQARAIVAATGCREKTGRQIFLHGERPAGIFTAGQAQDLVNLKGYLPGHRCVILGSGDIGLIMARRLMLEGAEVLGVREIGSRPSGLNRNIAQCLEDYDIPLHLRSTVTEVHGRERVEGVTVCRVDDEMKPVRDSAERIDCDCLILSVGLIPENDILGPLGVRIDPATRGPEVDQFGHTSVRGVFSCGNALHVSDLVDYVSESGHTAGEAAALYAAGKLASAGDSRTPVGKGGLLSYLLPQYISAPLPQGTAPLTVFFRPSVPINKADFVVSDGGTEVFRKRLSWLKPSEMQRIETGLSAFSAAGKGLSVRLEEVRTGWANG